MNLLRRVWMELHDRRIASGNSLLQAGEAFVVNDPLIFLKSHPKRQVRATALNVLDANEHVISLRFVSILIVCASRYIAQVRDAVVGLRLVNMVYVAVGPFAVNQQPRKAMGESTGPATKANADVAQRIEASSYIASRNTAARYLMRKNSGFRIVVQKFANALCGNIFDSHFVSVKDDVVRSPTRARNAVGLRHSNVYAHTLVGGVR